MKNPYRYAVIVLAAVAMVSCSGVSELASTEPQDTTKVAAYEDLTSGGALLSAFYGLDDAIPFIASYRICGELGHDDGMPVIFSTELDMTTVQAGDFLVTLADGRQVVPGCVTPAPAQDVGELRTMLMIGDFGSVSNQPVSVEIIGNTISIDHRTNFKGQSVAVTPLEAGPSLIHAELVGEEQWELGKEPSALRFGGGSGCPANTQQIVRAVWMGGVTKPGGDEIDDTERQAYSVIVEDADGATETVTPFAVADLGDGDNNHKLCLDVAAKPIAVEFPAGLMTDPRDDPNPATSVRLSN